MEENYYEIKPKAYTTVSVIPQLWQHIIERRLTIINKLENSYVQ